RKSWQHSSGPVTDFQDDARLIGTFNGNDTTLTGGLYYSYLTTEQHYLFSTLLTDVTPQVHRVDITILNATTRAWFGSAPFYGSFHFVDQYRNSTGQEREVSPYALLEHKAGPITLDAGWRHNIIRQTGTREFTATTFTSNGGVNPALTSGQFGT